MFLSFKHGEGIRRRRRFVHEDLLDRLAAELFAILTTRLGRPSGSSQAIFVCDLAPWLMDYLWRTFKISPEIFEEHLIQSGYSVSSYDDPDSSTWPTRFLRKQHVSLRWYSPVRRKDMEPRSMFARRKLVGANLSWDQRVDTAEGWPAKRWHQLETTTNIFRQEWLLSAGPNKPKMDSSTHDTDEESDPGYETDGEETDWRDGTQAIAAWEERITFCWGRRDGSRRRKFDPKTRY
jgi:hypothetical protein